MTRADAIARARQHLHSGEFLELLDRRVGYRTESQNPRGRDALRAYLVEELTPAFAKLDFATRLIESPSGKGPYLLADYFEDVAKSGGSAKSAANWIQTELLRRLNDSGKEINASPVGPVALAELLKLVEAGKITGAVGKKVFATMFESGRGAEEIVAAEGLTQISDTSAIEQAARDVIAKNPENVAKFKSGNEGVFKFFVGQVMKATRGQANPQVVNDILRGLLS